MATLRRFEASRRLPFVWQFLQKRNGSAPVVATTLQQLQLELLQMCFHKAHRLLTKCSLYPSLRTLNLRTGALLEANKFTPKQNNVLGKKSAGSSPSLRKKRNGLCAEPRISSKDNYRISTDPSDPARSSPSARSPGHPGELSTTACPPLPWRCACKPPRSSPGAPSGASARGRCR